MNKPYTHLEVKELPYGLTPTPFANRKQRRSKEYADFLAKLQSIQLNQFLNLEN